MAAPTKVYVRKVWANVTAEQLAAVNREAALTGSSISDVVRAAIDAHLRPRRKRGKAS